MAKNQVCHLCGGELEPYGIGKLKCKYCDTIYEEEVINGEEGILLVEAYKALRDGETDEAYKAFIDIIDRSPKVLRGLPRGGARQSRHRVCGR